MKEVLTNIFSLFYLGNPDSPYGIERADELRNNNSLYEKKIQFFTKKYALPEVPYEEFNEDWDFSYSV